MRAVLLRVPFEVVRVTPCLVKTASRAVELKDAPVVAAAKRARVEALVTFDHKHLLRPSEPAAFHWAHQAMVARADLRDMDASLDAMDERE